VNTVQIYLAEAWFWFDMLRSSSPDAEKVYEWVDRHPLLDYDLNILQVSSDQGTYGPASPCEEALFRLAWRFSQFEDLTEWERTSSEDRNACCLKVAKLVREAAELLESKPGSKHPPALALFEEERALDIIRALPPNRVESIFKCTRFEEKDGVVRCCIDGAESGRLSAANALALQFSWPKAQEMPSLLRRLAEYEEEQAYSPKREPRPNTPTTMGANARAFARHLTAYFESHYNLTPDEIIAACVALRFPDCPPDADDVRSWRGAR
jgi:hypothetical protein